jgi:hypothetical protein
VRSARAAVHDHQGRALSHSFVVDQSAMAVHEALLHCIHRGLRSLSETKDRQDEQKERNHTLAHAQNASMRALARRDRGAGSARSRCPGGYARPANSRVSVETFTFSPSLIKRGTRISRPVSSLTILVTLPLEESPRAPGSA